MSARQLSGPSAMRKGDVGLGDLRLHMDGVTALEGLAQHRWPCKAPVYSVSACAQQNMR